MEKLAKGLGASVGELLGMPKMSPDSIEAARLLSTLPPAVREPIVEAVRAISTWGGRRTSYITDENP